MTRLFVTVKTRAEEEKIVQVDGTHFQVSVRALPVEGQANDAVRTALAHFLGLSVSTLILRAGMTGKRKVFEVSNR